jgi:cold shock CspA family protein
MYSCKYLQLKGAGLTTPAEGFRVSYEFKPNRSGKMSVENLRIG